jgi:Tol biopolymer transport system component
VDLEGHQRLVWSGAGGVVLQDIASDGRALFIRENRRRGISGLFPGKTEEVDLSWQDWSLLTRISPDGKWIYFAEEGDGGGKRYSAYMRSTDGSPAIRLGDGAPYGVSPDGKWVASIVPGTPQELWLLPTRTGEAKNLSQAGFDYDLALWTVDGKYLVVQGREPGKITRTYIATTDSGKLTAVTPEGVTAFPAESVNEVKAINGEHLTYYPLDGSAPRNVKVLFSNITPPTSGLTEGRTFLATEGNTVPKPLFRYDTVSGEKTLVKELVPADRAGVFIINLFDTTPDGRYYAYSYVRDLSDLYMVEGLR